MQAVVGITDEDMDPVRLADRINTTMAKALATAKRADGVRVKGGGYSTHPVHEKGKLRRWRASQDLILESADVDAVTKLVGTLQNDLQLRSIGFSVSPERRRGPRGLPRARRDRPREPRREVIRDRPDLD
jgi:predicted secreted protein